MTTIVWDGQLLAADKRSTYGTMINTVTKIWRVRSVNGRVYLVGGSGEYGQVEAMKGWVEGGFDHAKFPPGQSSRDDYAAMIVVDDDNRALLFERTPFPIMYDNPPVCIGSGREFARAGIEMGMNAVQAVELACRLDSGSGNGVDVLSHTAVTAESP